MTYRDVLKTLYRVKMSPLVLSSPQGGMRSEAPDSGVAVAAARAVLEDLRLRRLRDLVRDADLGRLALVQLEARVVAWVLRGSADQAGLLSGLAAGDSELPTWLR